MFITTTKSDFKLLPEGENLLKITSVKLLPSGKPQKVEMTYSSPEGTLTESFDLNVKIGREKLGKRCDVLYHGDLPEGTAIEVTDIPDLFLGKIANVVIKHNASKKDPTRMFANIYFIKEFLEDQSASEAEEDLAEDEDDL